MILQAPSQSRLSASLAGRLPPVRGQARAAWPWLLPDPGLGVGQQLRVVSPFPRRALVLGFLNPEVPQRGVPRAPFPEGRGSVTVLHGGEVCTCSVQALFVQNKRVCFGRRVCMCVCLSSHASECPCVCVLVLPCRRSGCPQPYVHPATHNPQPCAWLCPSTYPMYAWLACASAPLCGCERLRRVFLRVFSPVAGPVFVCPCVHAHVCMLCLHVHPAPRVPSCAPSFLDSHRSGPSASP